jgi:hypothetical protein
VSAVDERRVILALSLSRDSRRCSNPRRSRPACPSPRDTPWLSDARRRARRVRRAASRDNREPPRSECPDRRRTAAAGRGDPPARRRRPGGAGLRRAAAADNRPRRHARGGALTALRRRATGQRRHDPVPGLVRGAGGRAGGDDAGAALGQCLLARQPGGADGHPHPQPARHREGGVRVVPCFLPIKSPWLNPIEPKGGPRQPAGRLGDPPAQRPRTGGAGLRRLRLSHGPSLGHPPQRSPENALGWE